MNNLIGLSGYKQSGKDTVYKILNILKLYGDMPNDDVIKDLNDSDLDRMNLPWENKKYSYKLKQIICLLTGVSMEELETEEIKNMTVSEYTGMDWSKIEVHRPYEPTLYFNSIEDLQQSEVMDELFNYSIVDLTFREWMQLIGTECFREIIHPDTWIKSMFVDYKLEDRPTGLTFNDDEVKFKRYPNWMITDVRFPNEVNAIKVRDGIIIRVSRGSNDGDKHFSETALDNYNGFDYILDNNGSLNDLINNVKKMINKLS